MNRSSRRWTRLGSVLVFVFGILAVCPISVHAQPAGSSPRREPGGLVSARFVPNTAAPGDSVRLEITIELEPGYHTYDIDQPDIPGFAPKITLEPSDVLRGSGVWTGTRPEQKNDAILGGRVNVHETSPTWSQVFEVAADARAGQHTITGEIRFQVCDDKSCVPRQAKLSAALEIKPISKKGAARADKRSAAAPENSGGQKTGGRPAATRPEPGHPAKFAVWAEPDRVAPGGNVKIHVRAEVDKPWHIYSTTMKQLDSGPRATLIKISDSAGFESRSGFRTSATPKKHYDQSFEQETEYHEGDVTWSQTLRVPKTVQAGPHSLKGSIYHMLCKEGQCTRPIEFPFAVQIAVDANASLGAADPSDDPPVATVAPTPAPAGNGDDAAIEGASAQITAANTQTKDRGSFIGFLLAAIGFGLGSVLTPCVFPMIPITVGFFLKQSQSRGSSAMTLASVYALTIVAVFTALGTTVALLAKFTDAVEVADFLKFGANPWFNAVMALVLAILALALFGVFELRLPSFLVQMTSSRESKGGLVGVIFMALTFVIMSTPCTGPFVGSVLVWASQGQWTWPVFGLIGYSAALASPFFLLGLVPSMLAKLPKGGGWLNSIKVVMGFVVLGTTFYFLVKADLTWESGLISRSLVLSSWAALAIAATLYLVGLLRLAHDGPVEGIGVARMIFAIAFLAAGLYFTAGLFGRRLGSWVEAILPEEALPPSGGLAGAPPGPGLNWVDNSFEQALARAQSENRPLFLDFTGKYCVNCKEMEQRVFPLPTVVERFSKMVLAKLSTDRGTLEDDANAKLQKERFGTPGLPLYVILSPDGQKLAELGGKASEREFVAFLDRGLQQWAAVKDPVSPPTGSLAKRSNGDGPSRGSSDQNPPAAGSAATGSNTALTEKPAAHNEAAKFWQPFDLAGFEELRKSGRNVVVDWTSEY